MRVLIIDDDKPHGETLADVLNSKGQEAYFAPSLQEARWLLKLFPFQLALVDYDMPSLTGPQVVKTLQGEYPELKAIVMSAHHENSAKLCDLGSSPFLPKPISIDQLLGLMTRVLDERTDAALVVRISFPLQKYESGNEE